MRGRRATNSARNSATNSLTYSSSTHPAGNNLGGKCSQGARAWR